MLSINQTKPRQCREARLLSPDSSLGDLSACAEDDVTHRLRILAVVSRPVLGQPLLLLVKGARLQDHLLQLKGGVAVEATFL